MTKLVNKTSKTVLCSVLAIFLVSGVAMAADSYQTSGQYAAQNNIASVAKKSGEYDINGQYAALHDRSGSMNVSEVTTASGDSSVSYKISGQYVSSEF